LKQLEKSIDFPLKIHETPTFFTTPRTLPPHVPHLVLTIHHRIFAPVRPTRTHQVVHDAHLAAIVGIGKTHTSSVSHRKIMKNPTKKVGDLRFCRDFVGKRWKKIYLRLGDIHIHLRHWR